MPALKRLSPLWKTWAALVLTAALPIPSSAGGRLVAANDDWIFSEPGFAQGDAGRFAQNVCAWFTGGKPGRFLVYSTHFGLTGRSLSNAVVSAGHTWVVDANAPFTLADLSKYDGVFLGWGDPNPQVPPVDFQILKAYLESSGNVYLFAGSAPMSRAWNPLLAKFGLAFGTIHNGVGRSIISDGHRVFEGVKILYRAEGVQVSDLDSAEPRNQALAGGLFGIWDGRLGLLPNVRVQRDVPPRSTTPRLETIAVSSAAGEVRGTSAASALLPASGFATNVTIRLAAQVCWPTKPGLRYQVQWASQVDTNVWNSLGTSLVGDGSTNCIIDPVLDNQRFYRVIESE